MATGGTYLYDELTQKMPGVLEKRYKNLPFESGEFIPTAADLQPGISEISMPVLAEVGDAEFVQDAAQDIPLVDVSATEDRYKTYMCASGFGVTLGEEQAYAAGGKLDGVGRKMLLARRAIAERMSAFAAYGHAGLGQTGFFNNANVNVANFTFNFFDPATSADQMVDFFVDLVRDTDIGAGQVYTDGAELGGGSGVSSSLLTPDVIVPTEIYYALVGKRITDGAMTVLQYLTQPDMPIRRIRRAAEASAANLQRGGIGNGTDHRIVVYTPDSDMLERHVSLTDLAPQDYVQARNLRKVYPMYGVTTPTIVSHPLSMRYATVPVAA